MVNASKHCWSSVLNIFFILKYCRLNIHHVPSVWLNHDSIFPFPPERCSSTVKTDLTCEKHPLNSSKNWKHLHKCCFHGHLSCFCLALNGKAMSGFWPEPQTKKVSKPPWLTSRQPRGLAELSWAAEGWGLRTLTPAPVVWWRDLAFQRKKKRQRPLLKAEVPQGDVLMHDGWNKIKWNGINPSSSSYWWRGGGCCSPLATLNLRLALPSIVCVLLYRTPTGALREKGLF